MCCPFETYWSILQILNRPRILAYFRKIKLIIFIPMKNSPLSVSSFCFAFLADSEHAGDGDKGLLKI